VGYAYSATYSDTADYARAAPAGDDGDWTISGIDMYSGVSGNVGVGATSPSYKLDVVGDVSTNSRYRIDGYPVLSTTGTTTISVGVEAGLNNTGGFGTIVGYRAGYSNQGDHNTFLGRWAGFSNTTGYRNTLVGGNVGYKHKSGIGNVFLGYEAGRQCSVGTYNVFLGYRAGYYENDSNRLYIDNSNTTSPLIYGEFDNDLLVINGSVGVGTTSPIAKLEARTATGAAVKGEHTSTGNFGILGTEEYGIWSEGDSAGTFGASAFGNGLLGMSASGYGVYGRGNKGVCGEHPTIGNLGYLGDTYFGVIGEGVDSATGGVKGIHNISGNYGILGTDEHGVFAEGDSAGVRASSAFGKGVHASSASGYGVYGTGSKGVYGGNPTSGNFGRLGETYYGVYGETGNDMSAAVFGKDAGTENTGLLGSAEYGVRGDADSGYGVMGVSLDSSGVYGISLHKHGVHGSGDKGVYGEHPDGNYGFLGGYTHAIYGENPADSTEGFIASGQFGVFGQHQPTGNTGSLGQIYAGVSGSSNDGWAVYGYTNYGHGMHGVSNYNCGVFGTSWENIGVYGEHTRYNNNYGYLGGPVYGMYATSENGPAGFFDGEVHFNDPEDSDLIVFETSGTERFSITAHGTGADYLSIRSKLENPDSTVAVFRADGRVGIGTTSPAADLHVVGDIYCSGKLTSVGGNDPPYVLYDRETRSAIVKRVADEVPEDKLGGAVLFWNDEDSRFEVYRPLKGEFRDLMGNLIGTVEELSAVR
jgi:hypothetical protein